VLPLATSVDGLRFSFQASLHGLELQAGGYVVLDDRGAHRLGQVLSVELHQQLAGELMLPPSAAGGPETRTELQLRYARGEGIVVDGGTAPFHDAQLVGQAEFPVTVTIDVSGDLITDTDAAMRMAMARQ
jgi:hypothetical protein